MRSEPTEIFANASVLAGAVIRRAVQDYKGYLRHARTRTDYRHVAAHGVAELETFFRSPWCDMLCDLCGLDHGDHIMRLCKQEAAKRDQRKEEFP